MIDENHRRPEWHRYCQDRQQRRHDHVAAIAQAAGEQAPRRDRTHQARIPRGAHRRKRVRRPRARARVRAMEGHHMIETATGKRVRERRLPFPSAWGSPPTDANEAQIAGWALGNIAWGRALQASGVEVRWLAKTQGGDALARLERRIVDPTTASRTRQAQLIARRGS
jgi:hypothetical protein